VSYTSYRFFSLTPFFFSLRGYLVFEDWLKDGRDTFSKMIDGVNETFHLNYRLFDYGLNFYGALENITNEMDTWNNTYLLAYGEYDFQTIAVDMFNSKNIMYMFPDNGHRNIYNSDYGLSTGTAFEK